MSVASCGSKEETVAIRALPNGTEYLFTAIDMPREDKLDMPPAGEMQVFFTALEGQAPVFTRVVRQTTHYQKALCHCKIFSLRWQSFFCGLNFSA